METVALIDLLRKTLVRHGHIVPTSSQDDCGPRVLNQGEFLVSILSHDEQTLDFLDDVAYNSGRSNWLGAQGDCESGYLIGGSVGRDLDLYVEVVKFVWLTRGVTCALDFVKNTGLRKWSKHSETVRTRYVDNLVLMAQRDLRLSGVKYSDMAELFQDIELAKARSEFC